MDSLLSEIFCDLSLHRITFFPNHFPVKQLKFCEPARTGLLWTKMLAASLLASLLVIYSISS